MQPALLKDRRNNKVLGSKQAAMGEDAIVRHVPALFE